MIGVYRIGNRNYMFEQYYITGLSWRIWDSGVCSKNIDGNNVIYYQLLDTEKHNI